MTADPDIVHKALDALDIEANGNGHKPIDIRELRLTKASTIKIRPVHWLWKHRIPLGSLSLIGGREGIGKTILAYQLAADLTRGKMPGTFIDTPRAVIVAATEDSWEHTIVPRLMCAGADLDMVYRIDVTVNEKPYGTLSLPADNAELGQLVETTTTSLIILDPLMSRISGKLDTHKDAEVRQALEPLAALSDTHKCVVLGLIHVNKSGKGDALDRIMGSRAFAATARSVLFVMKDPEDPTKRLTNTEKNNLGTLDLPTLTFRINNTFVADTDEGPVYAGRMEWLEETDRTIGDALAMEYGDPETRSAVEEAMEWLKDHLEIHGPRKSGDVKSDAKKEHISDATLKRAADRLHVQRSSTGFPRVTFWQLPVARKIPAGTVPGWSEDGDPGPSEPPETQWDQEEGF